MRSFTLGLALGALLMLAACATIAPPEPPSLDLPKPPADLRAVRKGNKVTLTWTVPTATTDRQNIRVLGTTRICRGTQQLKECGTPIGDVATPPTVMASKPTQPKTGSYTDVLSVPLPSDSPESMVTYAVEVPNRDGRAAGLSNQVRVPTAPTLPPPDIAASVTSEGVALHWKSIAPEEDSHVWHTYRIYRRQEGTTASVLVQEIKPGAGEIMDRSFEWEGTYYYRATILTVATSGLHGCGGKTDKDSVGFPDCVDEVRVEGDDSPEIKVFAHDVFPPAVPSGLQAVFSGPGQQPFIDLVWAPVSDMDLAGYNVYRHEEGAAPAKLNAEPLKAPAYRDSNVAAGKLYIYSVTAIDVRGNESSRSDEAGENVP